MSAEIESKLWFGHAGDAKELFPDVRKKHGRYYSSDVLTNAVRHYEEVVMNTCQLLATECIPLAKVVSKDLENFFDDAHMTPRGNQVVADF